MEIILSNLPENLEIDEKLSDTVKEAVEKVGQLYALDNAEVSITLTDNEHIHEINREYRKVDRPTDVISFALNEGDEPNIEGEIPVNMLGDIIISVEKAIEQAGDYGHSVRREIAFLTVHGMLHLLGYDHIEEADRVEMRKEEDFVMEQLSGLDEISSRAMMGEFILYYRGKVFGGIYDDRLLVKPVPVAVKMMPDAELESPYDGAKKMILVDDVDNRQFLCELVESMWEELPEKKKKKIRTGGFVDEIDEDDLDDEPEETVQPVGNVQAATSEAHELLKKEIAAATAEEETEVSESYSKISGEPAEPSVSEEEFPEEEIEEEQPVEIKKLAIPRRTASQFANRARKEGDAPDVVRDSITKVTLFDYSDIIGGNAEEEEE